MAIKGSLKEASLPDVIQLLFLGRRTGCLALADRHNFGTIYFDEGHIVYAAIVNRRDRLGDIMVGSGRITPEQLAAAIEQQRGERDHKLGEILVEQGAIERPELEQYIRHQIEAPLGWLARSLRQKPEAMTLQGWLALQARPFIGKDAELCL